MRRIIEKENLKFSEEEMRTLLHPTLLYQTPSLPDSEPRFNVPLKKQIPIRHLL